MAGVDFPARNNLFSPYDIQWLTFTGGHTSQDHVFGDDAFWTGMWRRWIESGSAYRGLDRFIGNPSPIYQEWVNHPDVDDYWESYNPSLEQYGQMRIPILTITGMYDGDQPGALAHYRRLGMSAWPVRNRARTALPDHRTLGSPRHAHPETGIFRHEIRGGQPGRPACRNCTSTGIALPWKAAPSLLFYRSRWLTT